MSEPIVVHGFETSNNMKVRVALGYKGLPYEFRSIDPAERAEVIRLSGQHLTPVMVHGEVVLFDSAAILRYLDTAFPETPRLFGRSRDEQWEIEDWELFARATLAGPMMEVVHRRVSGRSVDDAMMKRCGEAFSVAAIKLTEGLRGRDWLVGSALSAADVTAAAVIARVLRADLFALPAIAEASLPPWVDRVMAYDRGPG